jgi:hypothetical protein
MFYPSPRQNFLEMRRVRLTHHCEPKTHGFLPQMTPFWNAFAQTSYCAERTLQEPSEIVVYLDALLKLRTILCGDSLFLV